MKAEKPEISGIYPHLAMFNDEGECGTGAVVPWADKLWVITYGPHLPKGSSDKLYSISTDLDQTIHQESIGGTPANRMIHEESSQLFIGPYVVGDEGDLSVISYKDMPGRHTGNARHLSDPAGKIYYATMEEGFYEVDVESLEVTELFADDQRQTGKAPEGRRLANLPGYHGKGLYSGQGVLVYANNGERSPEAKKRPDIPSGVLAEWDGKSADWKVVRRNQFTEVTGPGGITGNPNPATDPIWAVGWDTKSIILALREPEAGWSYYRLPKGSHSYDGAHGWNTEWPRIRDIGEEHMLMTMHGTFWQFPKSFSSADSAGILPRSNYLKIIGDFCRWGDRVVLGCDDVANKEFLNKRKAKGEIAASQSQSNLWFVEPDLIDELGPAIGRGMAWEKEDVAADAPSDPYLFAGYHHRGLHITHDTGKPVSVLIERDLKGNGSWEKWSQVTVDEYAFVEFDPADQGVWVRLRTQQDAKSITAAFTYREKDDRGVKADPIFEGLAKPGQSMSGGLVRARNHNKRTLAMVAMDQDGKASGYYEMDEKLELKAVKSEKLLKEAQKHTAIPKNRFLSVDEASVIFVDDVGKRWRLPKGNIGNHPMGSYRIAREIVTERDIFNADGTLYELPARNAGGLIKLRPVTTHNRMIHDLCGYRGLLIMTGVSEDAPDSSEHIIKSADGHAAVWAGVIDDLWKLGKARGMGGPWKDTKVEAGIPSDPYLMTGYDKKSLKLVSSKPTTITIEADITGNGDWVIYKHIEVDAEASHTFPDAFSAYWVRFRSSEECTASAILTYE